SDRRSGSRAATTFRKLPSASPGASAKTASATSTRRRLAARGRESEKGLHRDCSVALDGADRQPGEARILEDPLGHSLLFSAAVVPELSDCAQSSTIAKAGASCGRNALPRNSSFARAGM